MCMRSFWLNVILRLSNRIYRKERLLGMREGISVIMNRVSLFFLKAAFALVTLPLHFIVIPQKVTVFLEKEHAYANVIWNYKVRRLFI